MKRGLPQGVIGRRHCQGWRLAFGDRAGGRCSWGRGAWRRKKGRERRAMDKQLERKLCEVQ